jgi:hypothetical protein
MTKVSLHKLSLNLYFDAINGQPGALDQTVTLGFSEKDNIMMGYVVVPMASNITDSLYQP